MRRHCWEAPVPRKIRSWLQTIKQKTRLGLFEKRVHKCIELNQFWSSGYYWPQRNAFRDCQNLKERQGGLTVWFYHYKRIWHLDRGVQLWWRGFNVIFQCSTLDVDSTICKQDIFRYLSSSGVWAISSTSCHSLRTKHLCLWLHGVKSIRIFNSVRKVQLKQTVSKSPCN